MRDDTRLALRITESALYSYTLPYTRKVVWFRSSEVAGCFVALRIRSEDGACGVAEATVKPTWSGLSPGALVALVKDILLPALASVDVADATAVRRALAVFPCDPVAKMLVGNACASLAAARAGVPLWQALGGERGTEVSWCVTRQAAAEMAAEAAKMVARHGFHTLKLKGGQGLWADRDMIRAVRRAVGGGIKLVVDANGAYAPDEARDYVQMLADETVALAEDPCILPPGDAFAAFIAQSPIPVLVDMPSTTERDAEAYLAAGATALSVKPGRVGIAEAQAMAIRCHRAGAGVCSGMYAESALGALISLQATGALGPLMLSAEQSFFLMMPQVLHDPLTVHEGRVILPATSAIDSLIDWAHLARASDGV